MEKLQNSPERNRLQTWSWVLYDWANSSFTTIILTFVFSAYFAKAVAADEISGTTLWSYALAASGLGLAILGPLLGAMADHLGGLKRWVALTMLLCLLGTLVLWLAVPQASTATIFLVLVAVAIANIGFELSIVFNNALLTHVAKPHELGKISSLAWGVGYIGGLVSLVLVLFGFIGLGDMRPWFDVPREHSEHIRACAILVVGWYALFSVPFFLFVKEERRTSIGIAQAFQRALISLKESWHDLIHDKVWRNFLIGSAFYRDGLSTLFAMGGIYAATRYDLETAEILLFGIGINLTAGLGCLGAALIEDRIGSLRTAKISIVGLLLMGVVVLLAPDKIVFFIAALLLGIFVGPLQSSSRTLVTKFSKPEDITERYGLYALSGRAVAFVGPFMFGLATSFFVNQQAGMATILLIWLIGFLFIRNLRDPS